jgi:hypothetical protein
MLEIRVHLAQMSPDIRLDLTWDVVAVSLDSSSPSAAEAGSGLCWNFAVSEKFAGPVTCRGGVGGVGSISGSASP